LSRYGVAELTNLDDVNTTEAEMNFIVTRTALPRSILLTLALFVAIYGKPLADASDPEAYLRFDSGAVFIEVYMKQPLAPGQSVGAIRASLRDTAQKKLLSATVSASPEGDSNFRILFTESEAAILEHLANYVVFVDTYPTSSGNIDVQLPVTQEVDFKLEPNPSCTSRNPLSITVSRNSDKAHAVNRIEAIRAFLSRPDARSFSSAQINQDGNLKPGTVSSLSKPVTTISDALGTKEFFVCVDFAEVLPPGESELQFHFDSPAPLELRAEKKITLESSSTPSATNEERDSKDFFDLGLTLTSSVANETLADETVRRTRTTRGALDLYFAPILNKRIVGASGAGGWVQVFTPFYIDAKAATGKITADTLSLNTINLGSAYEFRHYLNTHAYPDLLRHALNFKHTSDRDFKQDEFKFTYEFQPIFGAINQPLGSAPNILRGEVVEDKDDQFGLEIVPIVGLELGRTYRVRDPNEFEGVSRNVRRLIFGADLTFDLTRFVRLALSDRFYVRGETPNHRTRNYFLGSLELPLSNVNTSRVRAAHALFISFERGDQPPFTNPSVNVFKFGYRIRTRGLLNR
jgi:hypothetical protein